MITKYNNKWMDFPQDIHGYRLPNIEIWNKYFAFAKEEISEGWELGALDELLIENPSGICSDCGENLIRIEGITSSPLFRSGLIYCPNTGKDHPQKKKTWLEIWPDANSKLNHNEQLRLPSNAYTRGLWMLSNPIIKECYSDFVNILIGKPTPVFTHP